MLTSWNEWAEYQIDAILAHPKMWANSPETLEISFIHFLVVIDRAQATKLRKEYLRFCNNGNLWYHANHSYEETLAKMKEFWHKHHL